MTAARKRSTGYRQNMLAKVHIAKKQLGLDETTYRDVVELVTGKRSSGKCTNAELDAVLSHMQDKGWKPKKPSRNDDAEKYLGKCRALWISGWNLGVVHTRQDEAMNAFIKRMTGLDSERWLIHAEDAMKAIEAIKAMLARDGGVYWDAPSKYSTEYYAMPGFKICDAQWRRLREFGAVTPGRVWTGRETRPTEELLGYAHAILGPGDPNSWHHADWARVSQALGRKLRKAMGAAA